MKHIKKIEQFIQESIIGKDIVVIKPSTKKEEVNQDKFINERTSNLDIGKDIVVIKPGSDKIYL